MGKGRCFDRNWNRTSKKLGNKLKDYKIDLVFCSPLPEQDKLLRLLIKIKN